MKNFFPFLLAVVFFASCSKDALRSELPVQTKEQAAAAVASNEANASAAASLPGSVTVPILAGQHIPVGNLTIANDAYLLYVTYEMTGDYKLSETHLYAGAQEGIPVAGNGNAVPGRFPYKTTHNPAVSSFTYTIPLSDVPNCMVIAAHCVVTATNESGQVTFNQTGWSQGPQVNPGGNWAMFTDYCEYYSDVDID